MTNAGDDDTLLGLAQCDREMQMDSYRALAWLYRTHHKTG